MITKPSDSIQLPHKDLLSTTGDWREQRHLAPWWSQKPWLSQLRLLKKQEAPCECNRLRDYLLLANPLENHSLSRIRGKRETTVKISYSKTIQTRGQTQLKAVKWDSTTQKYTFLQSATFLCIYENNKFFKLSRRWEQWTHPKWLQNFEIISGSRTTMIKIVQFTKYTYLLYNRGL